MAWMLQQMTRVVQGKIEQKIIGTHGSGEHCPASLLILQSLLSGSGRGGRLSRWQPAQQVASGDGWAMAELRVAASLGPFKPHVPLLGWELIQLTAMVAILECASTKLQPARYEIWGYCQSTNKAQAEFY